MAAWYNGSRHSIFNISDYEYNTNTMLEQFWVDLIQNNRGKICYFHNWGGYDSILSMPSLFNLPGYEFEPMVNNGEVMCLTISNSKGKTQLTIKDSIRLLPGALGKLARDWKVETQKEHFPHYFYAYDLPSTIKYEGPLPPYVYFEPKRTSQADYEILAEQFKDNWSFLEVSRTYILGDVKALYQIMIAFFEAITSKFSIDPLSVVSAPSTAFKIWRTVQLPLLLKDNLKVFDLSHNLDAQLRESYCGGIVDVYRPHLIGEGYYYDVNSLYPTAMIRPMPVGLPKSVNLTVEQFLEGNFFGFVEATVLAPAPSTHAGYIGLLPIKLQGKLICPGGTFSGLFFSEELRFALANGYKLLEIGLGFEFERGENCFKDLITQLNRMKIEAQLNNQPTIRNISKLLMNSMYGRFGMHPSLTNTSIWTQTQINSITNGWLIQSQIQFGELSLVTTILNKEWILENLGKEVLLKHLVKMGNNTNVAIASAVTAYSRMIINGFKLEALKLGRDIYYSDTDSLVLNGPLPEELISSTVLGKLKLEYKFKEGLFITPKIYCLELEDGKLITKCKGYSGKLSKEQYLQLLEGKPLDLQVTKWTRSLKDSTIDVKPNFKYTINPNLTKRYKVIRDGVWTNTKPIVLRGRIISGEENPFGNL
uniref:Probable DNA polymerase n=1 Tax=Rhizophagus irregularis TaxID=588596 RepID=I6WIA1_9GLOM|nr:DNA polymerase B 2 [Rhizophagus irregularis]